MGRANGKAMKKAVDDWNATVPVGNAVKYYGVLGDESSLFVTSTRSEAFILSGHTPCVWLCGKPGMVALRNCEPITEPTK